MGKTSNKHNWRKQREKDIYFRQAKQSNYRSRAVYKLIEIDNKDHLFKPKQTVIDLGSTPGSWCQYVSKKISRSGVLVAIDILPMQAIENVSFIQGDFTVQTVSEQCIALLNNNKADIIISDMAPNLSGIKIRDQMHSLHLADQLLNFAQSILKQGGDLLIKVFSGEGTTEYQQRLKQYFSKNLIRKPKASMDNSCEFYILARNFQT